MAVPIDRRAWSPASQRSRGHYDEAATEYEGIRCKCRACKATFVLSAEDQKLAYEVYKKYVWWLPARCASCAQRVASLSARDRTYQERWNSQREALKNNGAFLREWHGVLSDLSRMGKTNSMLVHIERALASLPTTEVASGLRSYP
jgi:hypothetical protein